jgi:uncharacterized BrkB/YihY/UPF0761 family membrane protein
LAYFKSVIVGFMTVVIVLIAMAVAVMTILAIKSRHLPPGQSYAWDPVSFFQNSFGAWILLVIAFTAGFIWEYRRVMAHH